MIPCAKEGSRTPTRVTPLEPEGTESSGKLQTVREVRPRSVGKPATAKPARNRKAPHDNGSRSVSRTLVFWKAEPASWGFG